jgi:hypothetical protein
MSDTVGTRVGNDWTPSILAAFFERRLEESDRRYQERYEQSQETVTAGFRAFEERLIAMNEMRVVIADQAARMITKEQAEQAFNTVEDHITQAVAPLRERVNQLGKPNWTIIVGFCGVAATVITGCWLLVGLEISVAEAPLAQSISNLVTTTTSLGIDQGNNNKRLDEVSKSTSSNLVEVTASATDRKQLNDRLARVETSLSQVSIDRRTADDSLDNAVTELRGMICSMEALTNQDRQNTLRIISMLWKSTHPTETYPTDTTFIPTVCHAALPRRQP